MGVNLAGCDGRHAVVTSPQCFAGQFAVFAVERGHLGGQVRAAPPLSITSSAAARRSLARRLGVAACAGRPPRLSPSRAIRRRTCSSSGQSTTRTRSTTCSSSALDQERNDEDLVGPRRGCAWRSSSREDLRVQDRLDLAARRRVGEQPPAQFRAVEPARRGRGCRRPARRRAPRARGCRARRPRARSGRCRARPRRARRTASATVDLPLAMPPVRPMRSIASSAEPREARGSARRCRGPHSSAIHAAPAR